MNVVSFQGLGDYGRFGNQLFQYAFLRIMAEKWGWGYACPAWEGQRIFGLVDPPVERDGQFVLDDAVQISASTLANFEMPKHLTDVALDIGGYFQFHTSFYRPHRDKIHQWFTFKTPPALPFEGRDVIAIHLRRGDYCESAQGYMFVPPNEWYLQWLEEMWATWERPALYIATDEPGAAADFKKYDPVVPSDFQSGFYALTQARAVAISNSTFSFVAAMLNTRANVFVRPVIEHYPMTGGLRRFDPWDAEPLLHRDRPASPQ